MTQIQDRFGNELQCGDFVCFIMGGSRGWRQTPPLTRAKIKAFISDKAGDWIVPELEYPYEGCVTKVLASRVVKCY